MTRYDPPGTGKIINVAEVGSQASARAAIARAIGQPKPEGLEDIALVRYAARSKTASIHSDLTPREWDMISTFPDVLAHLTGRLTEALGLDNPDDAQWELTYVQEGLLPAAIPTFTCPDCGTSSPHPDDVANSYCVNCHTFHPRPAMEDEDGQ